MPRYKDLSGNKYGRLFVVKRIGSTPLKRSLFLCKCDCGNTVNVIGGNLTSGTSTSCGCYKLEMLHGKANPENKRRRRLKNILRLMRMRCTEPSCKSYAMYGGRGISVCKEWLESFDSFYSWSMENGYKDDLTIDRIDNDGNYEPSNCRWATYEEQANNTRRVRYVEFNGEKMSMSRFARLINKNVHEVKHLLNKGYTTSQIIERK